MSTIKHLVISGGGPVLFQSLGAIQHLEDNKFIDMKNIESIYGTSAGAIMGVLLCLKYDWETINDYLIKRPWHELFKIKVESIFDAYKSKGIFDAKTIEKCFKPLLDAKDIPMDINMKDFYELSKIELHMYSFEVNEYKICDISYLTHPELSLITAIQMTCALPILVRPVCIDNKCFIDGGLTCNYPLNKCVESGKNPNEILGFKNNYGNDKNIINGESTMLDFLLGFLFKSLFSLSTDHIQPCVKYEVICNTKYLTIDLLKSALSSSEARKDLLNNGIESGKEFLSNLVSEDKKLEDSIQKLS